MSSILTYVTGSPVWFIYIHCVLNATTFYDIAIQLHLVLSFSQALMSFFDLQ